MHSPLILSLQVAIISTIFTTIIGIFFAYVVFRKNNMNGIADAILTLPMVLPPTVIGFFLLELFSYNSILGRVLNFLGISVIFNIKGAIIAAFIVSLPIMYKTVLARFISVNQEIILSARTLGITESVLFFKIILPISYKSIITGAVLSFARSLGEFGATIMIAGNIPHKTQTMSIRIYSLIQSGNYKEAYIWVGVMISISIVFMLIINKITSIGENAGYK
ncbi:molybdenum ABC transporter permease subunit [Candidatus Epulonipiscium fishelsonii]|uniref:Molybdenum ABC transporter permease subunit n=1 Tax=Candidatus Epulonipiscium fishelsonii TaxID=77094 RepID=A0ACC8XBM1_9FIRM|nr:molybdenum ABC transporter permease subunit [Epulopiscium sp. SCG-D08WGA-EpuloA1]OON90538.1 MAG: molybdenum ABC transporter permease subunit [Epulopiscium sp. AS2M-Bin002]